MGLVFYRGKFVYGHRHGFGLRWMPHSVQRAIVGAWNPIACRFLGHDTLDLGAIGSKRKEIVCTSCCKEWPPASPIRRACGLTRPAGVTLKASAFPMRVFRCPGPLSTR